MEPSFLSLDINEMYIALCSWLYLLLRILHLFFQETNLNLWLDFDYMYRFLLISIIRNYLLLSFNCDLPFAEDMS
jgi:hypothetical protein